MKLYLSVVKNLFKGPDVESGDEPMRMFGKELSEPEKRELMLKVYSKLKETVRKFLRPDGSKEAPAKTCKDLAIAYPNFPSGKLFIQATHFISFHSNKQKWRFYLTLILCRRVLDRS